VLKTLFVTMVGDFKNSLTSLNKGKAERPPGDLTP
jgi:hypothetical protein